MRPRIEVVAAVFQRPDGCFLLAQRPAGKVYAGFWEFPGGKVEPGESAAHALARELHEELGVEVIRAYPWLTRDHDYEHAAVRLRFYRVTEWSGEMHGREDQQFAWQRSGALNVAPVLPANGPILRSLTLPTVYGISNAGEVGVETFIASLEAALARGLRLVQIREKTLASEVLTALTRRVLAIAREYGARVLLNTDPELALHLGADGVHLTSHALLSLNSRPPLDRVGASCHNEVELARAVELGVDFVVLGSVAETASHPGGAVLGWERFAALVRDYPLPVYAIGGLRRGHLSDAWENGAHGIAAIRGCWSEQA